ncbi:hypothetical protein IWW38_004437, partial [Coemansia aciculifera]
MNLFRSPSAYSNLVSVSERKPGSSSELVSVLRNWRAPLEEFNADELGRALGRLDIGKHTLAYAQIVVDSAMLARSNEQFDVFASALRRLAAEGQFGPLLQTFPMMLQRLAEAAARTNDHALACGLLAD